MKKNSLFLGFLLFSLPAFAQSSIVYDTGTTIDVGAGADVSADQITVNGTYTGGGTFNFGPLPVELTSFTGSSKDGKALLRWTTATEVNNYGFEIERSKVENGIGELWTKIGFVQGHGNSNSPKEYLFVDSNPPCGKIKYRLKQVDLDGAFEYSHVIEITIDAPKSLSLGQNFPNPFNPSTTIKFTVPDSDLTSASIPMRVTLKVYDILGREVKTIVDEFLPAGYYSYSINAAEMNLTSGVYFYKLSAGGFASVKKMILMK